MSPIHSGATSGFSARSCHLGGHTLNVTRHVSSVHLGSSHKKIHGSSHYAGSHLSHHGGYHGKHHEGSHISHHKLAYPFHHGGHYSAPSVHGVSSGKEISKHSSGHGGHSKNVGSHMSWNKGGLLGANEKETMQALNDRLASYLARVSSLEQENDQLESNIRDWYDRNQPSALPDFSNYFRTIRELQGQISATSVENARIVLQIDNARLAADDFRSKYEMELRLTQIAEAEINGLRRLLEGLNVEICNLEQQVQNLQEELQQMKRNHEEEVNSLRAQLGQRVSVEVDAAPSVDLNRTLSEIRQQYEELMERNLREVENMFMQRSEELNREVTFGAAQLQSVQTELIDLRRNIQTLEIELQSQLSMKSALEGTLAETEATYNSQLSQLQGLINAVESQLAQIRSDLEQQNHQYRILMDQKTHLEMEIATYKRLLEGHDIHVSGHAFLGSARGSYHTSVKRFHHAVC